MEYIHGGDIYKFNDEMVDFSANINPLGMPMAVKQAICDNCDNYQCYPDYLSRDLVESLSRYYNILPDRIVCGNGAADLIYRICLSFKPQKVLLTAPTFSEYEKAALLAGGEIIRHGLPEEKAFAVDDSIVKAAESDNDINMIFICSPNNPTGQPVDVEIILALAEIMNRRKGCIVVDQCFLPFMEDASKYDVLPFLDRDYPIAVLHAFTKIFAMAGLRLGYGFFGDISFADKVRGTLQPWSVSTPASLAGVAALKETQYLKDTVSYVTKERKWFIRKLKSLGLKVFPTSANYILIKGDVDLAGKLEKKGILIRSCGNYHGLEEDFFRVAVRKREDNKMLLNAMEDIIWQKN